MKIIPKTRLSIDPKKPDYQPGKEVDVKKDMADELLERGLAVLPPVDEPPVDEPPVDASNADKNEN